MKQLEEQRRCRAIKKSGFQCKNLVGKKGKENLCVAHLEFGIENSRIYWDQEGIRHVINMKKTIPRKQTITHQWKKPSKSGFVSVPTQYNGVNFRSRLEARWAAFFDLLEWPWEYEPIDFNGWFPDFYLPFPIPSKGLKKLGTYVEVKPYVDLNDFQKKGIIKKVMGVASEVLYEFEEGCLYQDVLLLGVSPLSQLGLIISQKEVRDAHLSLFEWEDISPLWCINVNYQASSKEKQRIQTLWREAGNKVQWKSVDKYV